MQESIITTQQNQVGRAAALITENLSQLSVERLATGLYHLEEVLNRSTIYFTPDGLLHLVPFAGTTEVNLLPVTSAAVSGPVLDADTVGIMPLHSYHFTEGQLSFKKNEQGLVDLLVGGIPVLELTVGEVGSDKRQFHRIHAYKQRAQHTYSEPVWDIHGVLKPTAEISGMDIITLGMMFDLVQDAYEYVKLCIGSGTMLHNQAEFIAFGSFISEDKKKEYMHRVATHMVTRKANQLSDEMVLWTYLRSCKGLAVTNTRWVPHVTQELEVAAPYGGYMGTLEHIRKNADGFVVKCSISGRYFSEPARQLFSTYLPRYY